jgi:hypothetical protein
MFKNAKKPIPSDELSFAKIHVFVFKKRGLRLALFENKKYKMKYIEYPSQQ